MTTKIGAVLEGGAMRGLFTAGILDLMLEEQCSVDGMIGVSAGAVFGCNFKSRQPGRVLRYNQRFCRDKRYCSIYSWLTTGDLFGAEFCYHTLPNELDLFDGAAFEQNPMEFYAVCTEVATGSAVYHKFDKADDLAYEWMRASASMPIVSKPVKIDGKLYLDGAIADSIPLKFFESIGYQKNIVILTQVAEFRKMPSRVMPLLRWHFRKNPAFLRTLEERHILYNQTIEYVEEQARQNNVFLLRPEAPLPIQRICHDPDLLEQTWQQGWDLARKNLPQLKEFLQR